LLGGRRPISGTVAIDEGQWPSDGWIERHLQFDH
jgi:hypothetical protein